jgi:hypothetical protein
VRGPEVCAGTGSVREGDRKCLGQETGSVCGDRKCSGRGSEVLGQGTRSVHAGTGNDRK